MVKAKICGLSEPVSLRAAIDAGADAVGFVFFPPSPRAVDAERAAELAGLAENAMRVGLFVEPDDETLETILKTVPLDLLQLHGKETPDRVAEIRRNTGLPVMKAVSLRTAADLDAVPAYEEKADWLLFDAKPPAGAGLPGGNGVSFDWRLLQNRRWRCPVMLSGGLDAANLAEAVAITGIGWVDVSSGVESAPGQKDIGRIRDFLRIAHGLEGTPPAAEKET